MTTSTTTTPPTTPPLDAAAFASSLHAEVAKLRAAALGQRSLQEAAKAQLEALGLVGEQADEHAVSYILKSANETLPVYDDAASRLLAILQDVEMLRQQHAEKQRTTTRPVAAPAYPALRSVAEQNGLAKSFAVAVDSPSTKPVERYDFLRRLVGVVEMSTKRGAVVGETTLAELRQLYDAVVDQLSDLAEVAKALTKMRDTWRRKGSLEGEEFQQRLQRDVVFQKLDHHVQQMILLRRRVDAGTAADGDAREYTDLADLVLASLSSLPLPGGEIQALCEATSKEVRRLRGDYEVAATMRRVG